MTERKNFSDAKFEAACAAGLDWIKQEASGGRYPASASHIKVVVSWMRHLVLHYRVHGYVNNEFDTEYPDAGSQGLAYLARGGTDKALQELGRLWITPLPSRRK